MSTENTTWTVRDEILAVTGLSRDEAIEDVRSWYTDGGWDEELIRVATRVRRDYYPTPDELPDDYARRLCREIAHRLDYTGHQGHGTYHVSAADEARLGLEAVEEEDA